MRYYGLSNVGCVRAENEDTIYFGSNNDHQVLTVICDGMGGHRAGEIASSLVCQHLADSFHSISSFKDKEEVKQWLNDKIVEANTLVIDEGRKNLEYAGMGTTIVAAVIMNDVVYIASVGDSRLYMEDGHELRQITVDDSLVNMLVENGTITLEQSRTHPQRNVLLKAVGAESKIDVSLYEIPFTGRILLCSDGLYNELKEEEMMKIIDDNVSLEQRVETLVNYANLYGGHDNISVIVIEKDGDSHE